MCNSGTNYQACLHLPAARPQCILPAAKPEPVIYSPWEVKGKPLITTQEGAQVLSPS